MPASIPASILARPPSCLPSGMRARKNAGKLAGGREVFSHPLRISVESMEVGAALLV